MGNVTSTDKGRGKGGRRPLKKATSISADPERSFIFISNDRADVFEFDPLQTFMVAYGMDKQLSSALKELSINTVLGAYDVCMSLIHKQVVPKDHVQLFAASKDPDMCTYEGLKNSFQQQARRAGPEGLFVFHYSGHGVLASGRDGNKEWGLAPMDYDRDDLNGHTTLSNFISGPDLSHWLAETDCRAKYILFILDCCYSGGLAEELTCTDIELTLGLYVMSACTPFETDTSIGPLGRTIFAYFLEDAVEKVEFPPGTLPLRQIFEECGACCTAMSSLLISYDHQFGLKFGTMQPELKYFDLQTVVADWEEESLHPVAGRLQADNNVGRFDFVFRYYQSYSARGVERNELCELCVTWLDALADFCSPLNALQERGLLEGKVLRAVVCLAMRSVASIQLTQKKAIASDPNLFLKAFLHVAAALDCLHPGLELSLGHMKEALSFYLEEVEKSGDVSTGELKKLFAEVNRDWETAEEERKKRRKHLSQQNGAGKITSGDKLTEASGSCEGTTCVQTSRASSTGVCEGGGGLELQSITASWWMVVSHIESTKDECI